MTEDAARNSLAGSTLGDTQELQRRDADELNSRLLVHTIPGLVAIMTPAGEVDVVNHELVEYCGQPLEAMKEWGTNGTVHVDDLPRVVPVFTQAITSGDPYDFEARIRHFDGVYRWYQMRGLPFRDLRTPAIVCEALRQQRSTARGCPTTSPSGALPRSR